MKDVIRVHLNPNKKEEFTIEFSDKSSRKYESSKAGLQKQYRTTFVFLLILLLMFVILEEIVAKINYILQMLQESQQKDERTKTVA